MYFFGCDHMGTDGLLSWQPEKQYSETECLGAYKCSTPSSAPGLEVAVLIWTAASVEGVLYTTPERKIEGRCTTF